MPRNNLRTDMSNPGGDWARPKKQKENANGVARHAMIGQLSEYWDCSASQPRKKQNDEVAAVSGTPQHLGPQRMSDKLTSAPIFSSGVALLDERSRERFSRDGTQHPIR